MSSEDLTAQQALKLLRKWKQLAHTNIVANPLTLENPDSEDKPNIYKDWSYLQDALQPGTAKTGQLTWQVVQTLTKASQRADRAVGSLYGLVLGDAFGAPFEFLPVDSRLEPPSRTGEGCASNNNKPEHLTPSSWLSYLKEARANARGRPSHAFFDQLNSDGAISYFGEYNRFEVFRGQWTDDSSMALCLADSLLISGRGQPYNGSIARILYYNWLSCGVNNAFRYDSTPGRCSIGLGGNVGAALEELTNTVGLHKTAEAVPPGVLGRGEDAGNGSMMRLAPVPIRFAKDIATSMQTAAASSRATHPGPDAEACCSFMAHFISSTITTDLVAGEPLYKHTTLSEWLSASSIPKFLKDVPTIGGSLPESGGMYKVRDVLQCRPRDAETALWDWKRLVLPTEETLAGRGEFFNGHAVNVGYFGAYSVDGLCMALWSMHHDRSLLDKYRAQQEKKASAFLVPQKSYARDRFEDILYRIVNLRGDADTTGAIAGQMAGAFFGFQDMHSTDIGRYMFSCVHKWDPLSEIPLRALMLADDGGLLDDILPP